MTPTQALIARLSPLIETVDGKPATTPPGRYAAVYDDSGLARPERYGTRSHWIRWTHRIVVVGHGMVAHRFVAELAAHQLPGLAVTVLGDEPQAAYNRILLPDVLSGRLEVFNASASSPQ